MVSVEDTVEISMLMSGSSADLVEAWGRVAWVNSGGFRKKHKLPEGFGVEFQSVPEASIALIQGFIATARATQAG
jgi:hypothetical protein